MAITEIASGIGGQLLGLPEVTFGVAPTLTSPICWEFNTETLSLKKNTVQGRGLHAGGRFDRTKRRVLTNYDAGGAIEMDCPTRNLNTLLKACMGSADTNVYASNGTLTTNSDSTYTAVHIPGSNIGYSLCLQKGVPSVDGTVEPFTYVGCKVADWQLSVAVDQIAKLQLTIDARNELAGPYPNGGAAASGDPLNAATPALATWTDVQTGIFHFKEATLLTGGTVSTTTHVTSISAPTTATNIKNCTVKVINPIANKRINLGTSGFKLEQVDNGFRRSLAPSRSSGWPRKPCTRRSLPTPLPRSSSTSRAPRSVPGRTTKP